MLSRTSVVDSAREDPSELLAEVARVGGWPSFPADSAAVRSQQQHEWFAAQHALFASARTVRALERALSALHQFCSRVDGARAINESVQA